MKTTVFPIFLSVLLLAGAGCAARPVSPAASTEPSPSAAMGDAAPSTEWLGYHSDALKFSVSYSPDLVPNVRNPNEVDFSDDSGYGVSSITVFPTTAKDTAAWVAAQKDKLTPYFIIKTDADQQALEVVGHTVLTDGAGPGFYSTVLEAVEVSNGNAYVLVWRNETPKGTLLTLPNADTLKFLQSFAVDVPPLSPEDQAWHEANKALAQFLGLLHEGTYEAAGGLYGGDLYQLRDWNPAVDANDAATLWKDGCELNGLLCMQVDSITPVSHADGAWTFSVVFRKDDGTLYYKNGHSDFPFVVRAGNDGLYLVETMPPYQE